MTKKYRVKYQGIDTFCGACGEEEETAEHLMLFSKGISAGISKGPAVQSNGADFLKALGFKVSEGKIDFKRVEITKRRLSDSWLKSRQG